jgi:hypothetical protein
LKTLLEIIESARSNKGATETELVYALLTPDALVTYLLKKLTEKPESQ